MLKIFDSKSRFVELILFFEWEPRQIYWKKKQWSGKTESKDFSCNTVHGIQCILFLNPKNREVLRWRVLKAGISFFPKNLLLLTNLKFAPHAHFLQNSLIREDKELYTYHSHRGYFCSADRLLSGNVLLFHRQSWANSSTKTSNRTLLLQNHQLLAFFNFYSFAKWKVYCKQTNTRTRSILRWGFQL